MLTFGANVLDFDELTKDNNAVRYLASYENPSVSTVNNSTVATLTVTPLPDYFFFIGLSLAVSSSLFIGSSFVIKKKALLHLIDKGSNRAGTGGHGYLKDWKWWAGTVTMGVGEGCNFAAYAFAPAVLVTPLGALSVLVTAILSSIFLKESLNLLGKVGCALCILGAVVIVIHAPVERDVGTMDELAKQLVQPGFILYAVVVLCLSCIIIFYIAPRVGDRIVLVYVLLCSMIGSFVVVCTKGIGLAITESFSGQSQAGNVLTWVCVLGMVLFVIVNLNYLNKSLDLFSPSLVTPVYYVFFTLFVMVVSGVLYQEFDSMDFKNALGLIIGFLVTILGIFMMQIFREVHLDITQMWHMLSGSKDSSRFHFQIVQSASEESINGGEEEDDPLVNGRWTQEYMPIRGSNSLEQLALSASIQPVEIESLVRPLPIHYGSII